MSLTGILSRRTAFLAGYLVVLALATLTPFRYHLDLGDMAREVSAAFHPGYSGRMAVDAVRNVVLFAGWGALWIVVAPPRRIGRLLLTALGTGALLSVTVETAQLVMPTRTTSVMDVLTNSTGSALGAAFIIAMIGAANALRRYKSYVGVSALAFAGAYGVAVVIEFLFPMLRSEVMATGGPFTRFRAVARMLTPASFVHIPWLDMVLVFPLGVFGVAMLAESGWRHGRAARVVAAGGVIVAVVTEGLHAALGIAIQGGAVLAHAVGIGAGAWATAHWLGPWSRRYRGRRRPLGLALAYAGFLAVWAWRPFTLELDPAVLEQQFSLGRLVPLQAHAWRVELFSVADIVGPFFLYLPVGALLAAWPLRLHGVWSGYWPGLYAAAGLEIGQILVAGRYFDGTDLLVQCAAVLIGWVVMRKAGVTPYGEMLPRPGGRKVKRVV